MFSAALQVVDELYQNAAAWVGTSTIKSSPCKQLGLPNSNGQWYDRCAVLTPWCLFVFEAEGSWAAPVYSIPLHAAELIVHPRLLPAGAPPGSIEGPGCVGVAYPLGFAVLSFESAELAGTWCEEVSKALKGSQAAMEKAAKAA